MESLGEKITTNLLMKLEAMMSQGKCNALTLSQLGIKLEKEEIADGKYFKKVNK